MMSTVTIARTLLLGAPSTGLTCRPGVVEIKITSGYRTGEYFLTRGAEQQPQDSTGFRPGGLRAECPVFVGAKGVETGVKRG